MDKADSILIKALKTATDESFGFADTAQAVNHTFSARFEKRISRILVWDEMPSYFPKLKNAFIAVALAGVLLVLMGCASPEIIENIVNYFSVEYDNKVTYYWKSSDIEESLDKIYVPHILPDGYTQIWYKSETDKFLVVYEKTDSETSDFARIEFIQQIIPEKGKAYSTNNGIFEAVYVDGITVNVRTKEGLTTVFYEYEGYLFEINCKGDISLNEIVLMLQSLKLYE